MLMLYPLSPTANNYMYDYVNYVPNAQSNNYPTTTLISGVQEVSEDMWLHILIGQLIQTRLWEKSFFGPKFGLLCAGFLAGIFFQEMTCTCISKYI